MEATEAQVALIMQTAATIVSQGVRNDIFADEATTNAARSAAHFLAGFAAHIAGGKGAEMPFAAWPEVGR
jgi:hypothetical protein